MEWCRQHFLNSRALRKAVDIYKQLEGYLRAMNISAKDQLDNADNKDDTDGEVLRRALTSGLFMHAAMRQPDGSHPLTCKEIMMAEHTKHCSCLLHL